LKYFGIFILVIIVVAALLHLKSNIDYYSLGDSPRVERKVQFTSRISPLEFERQRREYT